ncbi:murein L,D-transpeptidase family protein [Sphingorhabdus arenilitoris]|uniref:Murein L,D-transpeptidase family protein n=1 Tax=Sphingorhabdus arenilitoris TaxID=1490041 RepID=A0ABV8REB6_9SPHN
MRIKLPCALIAMSLAACAEGQPIPQTQEADKPAMAIPAAPATSPTSLPVVADGVKANRIIVDKSDRVLILYDGDTEIARYSGIRFGDAPAGHKQFEGDEKTPEGEYRINGRNPASRYHLSLRISYPNAADRAYAKSQGKDPGGDIFIHGQPNGYNDPVIARDWTDGCIALSNAEIAQIWKLVPDGTKIIIQP